MTLYEQIQRERLTARIVADIYEPPIDKTVMLVDRSGPHRIRGRACAVRVQKPSTPVAPDVVMRATHITQQSKGRGS